MMEALTDFAKEIGTWSVKIVETLGYPGVFLLMAMESSIFPVPSELVMPPAGYLAAEGKMSLILVILLGTLGSMAGALANYAVAAWLGRAFLLRYGRWFLCPPKKLDKLEEFFVTHGAMGTFTGRLIPGVRHFISLPAGIVRMPLGSFLILTGLGSLLWVTILTLIGFYVGKNIERIKELAHTAVVWSVIGVLVFLVAYILWHKYKRKTSEKKLPRDPS